MLVFVDRNTGNGTQQLDWFRHRFGSPYMYTAYYVTNDFIFVFQEIFIYPLFSVCMLFSD